MVDDVERPDEAVWVRIQDAATQLGIATQTLEHHLRVGRLSTVRRGVRQQRWLLRSEVDALAVTRRAETGRWVSYVDAAAIIGRSRGTVRTMVAAGRLEQRHAGTTAVASISRVSAERVAAELVAAEAGRAAARAARSEEAPPDDDHEWVGARVAAELLQVTPNAARRMAQVEQVPAVRRGRRWWFRRDQLVVVANARAARGLQA